MSTTASAVDSSHENGNSGGDVISLSIDETNALRMKLGLRPLDEGKDGSSSKKAAGSSEAPVWKPANGLEHDKKTQEIMENIFRSRQRRDLTAKLGSIKGLGDGDDDGDDVDSSVAAWVNRSRKNVSTSEKRRAELRAKQLDDMENEMADDVATSNNDKKSVPAGRKKKPRELSSYTASDLSGMDVIHDVSRFEEGSTHILTLADKGILDGDEDVLQNVDMVDREKTEINMERRKNRPDYNPYDVDVDVIGAPKLLSKYDETLEGRKREHFQLGAGGQAEVTRKDPTESEVLNNGKLVVDLSYLSSELQTDYLTEEEMLKFKKGKKKKMKIRKKVKKGNPRTNYSNDDQKKDTSTVLKADDLLPLTEEDDDIIRKRALARRAEISANNGTSITDSPAVPMNTSVISKRTTLELSSDEEESDEDYGAIAEGLAEEDEAEKELQASLERTRRLKIRRDRKTHVLALAKKVAAEREEAEAADVEMKRRIAAGEEEEQKDDGLVLTATTEFVRTLDIGENDSDDERKVVAEETVSAADVTSTESRAEEIEETVDSMLDSIDQNDVGAECDSEDDDLTTEKYTANQGLAAALQLAKSKGFIESQLMRKKSLLEKVGASQLDTSKAIQIDGSGERDRRGGGGGGRDHDREPRDMVNGSGTDGASIRGPAELEVPGWEPNVKLEYHDEHGRELNVKEAFRQLCHQFHGMQSGRNTMARNMRKIALEAQSNNDSAQVRTATTLANVQRRSGQAHIVMSGAGMIDLAKNAAKQEKKRRSNADTGNGCGSKRIKKK